MAGESDASSNPAAQANYGKGWPPQSYCRMVTPELGCTVCDIFQLVNPALKMGKLHTRLSASNFIKILVDDFCGTIIA